MQIKTTMRYHHASIRIITIKNIGNDISREAVEKPAHTDVAGGNVKRHSLSGINLAVSYKTKHTTAIQLSICTVGYSS